jgi:hypothetical protein
MVFETPRISHPCYQSGEGVDSEGIRQRNQSFALR